jgi:glycosyltransferase 2 family protein
VNPPERSRGRHLAGWAVRIVLTVGVTWLIVRQVGLSLDEALTREALAPVARPLPILGSIVLLFAGFVASTRAWGRMVGELGGPVPGWRAGLRIVLTANLGRYIPGKVWQVTGLALLSRREGIPASLATVAAVLGQAFHLAGAGVIGLGVLAAARGLERGHLVGIGLLGALVLLASIPSVLGVGLRLAGRLARIPADEIPHPDALFGLRWIAIHAVIWTGYGIAFYLLAAGLGFEAPVLWLVPAFAAAYLAGYLAIFAPAGIGVREGVLIALLQPHLGAGAVGLAVMARIWMTAVELAPAGAMALWEIFRGRHSGTALDHEKAGHG